MSWEPPSAPPELPPELLPDPLPELLPDPLPEPLPELPPELAPELLPELAPELLPVSTSEAPSAVCCCESVVAEHAKTSETNPEANTRQSFMQAARACLVPATISSNP
jgi:hypothetical protein